MLTAIDSGASLSKEVALSGGTGRSPVVAARILPRWHAVLLQGLMWRHTPPHVPVRIRPWQPTQQQESRSGSFVTALPLKTILQIHYTTLIDQPFGLSMHIMKLKH